MKKARSRAQHGNAFSFESPPNRITKGNPATPTKEKAFPRKRKGFFH
jgi:hypothetical protein